MSRKQFDRDKDIYLESDTFSKSIPVAHAKKQALTIANQRRGDFRRLSLWGFWVGHSSIVFTGVTTPFKTPPSFSSGLLPVLSFAKPPPAPSPLPLTSANCPRNPPLLSLFHLLKVTKFLIKTLSLNS